MSGQKFVSLLLGGVVFIMLLSLVFYILVRRGDVAPPPDDSHLQMHTPRLIEAPAAMLIDLRP